MKTTPQASGGPGAVAHLALRFGAPARSVPPAAGSGAAALPAGPPRPAFGWPGLALSLLSIALFCLDLSLPFGSGVAAGYIVIVLLSLRSPHPRDPWIVASLCTVLLAGGLWSAHAAPPIAILLARAMGLLVIWTVAILGQRQRYFTHARGLAQAEAERALKSNSALKAALVRTEAAEAQLRRGQRLLDTVASMARIGGWEIDLASMTPIWSQEVYRIHEVDPATRLDLAGTLEFYAPEARPVIERALRDAIEHGVTFDHTVPFITAKGARRWVRTIGVAERTNGVTTRLSGAFQDVTDQHEIQMRLARASRSSSEGHWDYDFGTETVWCSATHEELLGFAAHDGRISAEAFRARVHPEDQPRISAAFEQHVSAGTPCDLQLRMQRASGEWRWYRMRGAVERDQLGRLVSFAGSLIDVHEERLAQEELREVRSRFERAINGTQDGLWEWDFVRNRLWMSPRYYELLGYREHELSDDPEAMRALVHPEDVGRVDALRAEHLAGRGAFDIEYRLRNRDGEYRWFRSRASVVRDAEGRLSTLAGSIQDITARRSAEAARLEAEHSLARAVRGSSDGLFDHDLKQARYWYSPRVREMLGYSPEEAFPHSLQQLMSQADRTRLEEHARLHFDAGTPFDLQLPLPTRQGEQRWFRMRGRAERDASGEPVRFSGSIQDITAQREAESALVAAKEAAAAANRAKSEFLANMSHEIRTPMNGVLGMTELLLDTRLEPAQHEFAETIRSSATALLGILNDLLDFSKIEAGRLEIECVEMDVRECVEDVATMMAVQAAAKNLEFIVNVDPAIPDLVRGDTHRLRQILTNLIGNAVKFTHQGEIVVEVLAIGVQSGRALLNFEVRDSGVGMTAEVLERLFQPFVQADASITRYYGGTGLGLSIVKRLVELMGGQVSVVSSPGQGSTFSFTLPCSLVEGAVSAEAPASLDPAGKRVLVVDDNQTNLRVLCGQLRPAGYTVDTAVDVNAALRQLLEALERQAAFDVVVVDDQMPGSDASSLAARIRQVPDLAETPLIMLTSLDRQDNVQRLSELGYAGYLTKPVRGRELRACVERVLALDASSAAAALPRLVTRGSLALDEGQTRYRGRILVVEDNTVNQQVTRRFLERLGCEVEVAENGQRAIEFCARTRYDLVLMDVQMPVMDGLTATREIRRHEEAGRRTPIIALTASAMTDELQRCTDAGMDGLLTKPLEPMRLRESLDQHGLGGAIGAQRPASAPAAARAAAQAIDLPRLRTIVGDDREFMHELCQTFLASSAKIVEELRRALHASDRVQLAALAHKLKGGSSSVCAQRVGDLAAALERNSRSKPLPELTDSVDQICAALQECAGFIEAQVA